MQGKNILLIFGILLGIFVAGIGYIYFVGASNKQEPSATLQAEKTQTQVQTKEVIVEGTEYAFNPDMLTLNKGEKIKLIFVNKGKQPHNLIIDELGLATNTITQTQETTLEFTANKAGSFKMYCGVGNHRALGMEGTVGVK